MSETLPTHGFCGTAGCLAGHVVLGNGFRLKNVQLVHPDGRVVDYMLDDYDDPSTVAGFAADWLGLDFYEAGAMFDPDKTLADLKGTADDLCAQPGRSEQSRIRLRWAVDRVIDADALGLWIQSDWISPT